MEVKNLLKKIDGQILYLEYSNFYEDMSKITDENYFIQVMQTKKGEEKQKIEEGIIYLSQLENPKDYEILFLEKYHRYLITTLEKDTREYYNNSYCNYLYSNLCLSLIATDNLDEFKFINGKSLTQLEYLVVDKHNQIMEKHRSGKELDNNDKKFIEESFLFIAYIDTVYKEAEGEKDLMYDIVDYFAKYPIKDLSDPRSKQLYILSILSSQMLNIPGNCAIQFSTDTIVDERGVKTLGSFGKLQEDGVNCIVINGLDIYELRTVREFLEKMFTLFHELAHLKQEYDDFNDEFKKIIEMELYLIKNNKDFYKKYHDSFYIERDADSYAIAQLIEEFNKQYPVIVYNIISNEQNRKRIDWPTFYLMELEEYGRTSTQQDTRKLGT
ncbi:MAG: hypothetical protein IJ509_01240 [Bacilli bacterium]|nr:hypothetical protein [Bacilli bacterium]